MKRENTDVQIILSTPVNLLAEGATFTIFVEQLAHAVKENDVSALLIRRNNLDNTQYKKLVKALIPAVQPEGCAVLLDNIPDLVHTLGADGVHISTGHTSFLAAIKMLKPHFIVGAGGIKSRHEAMLRGEAGADYVCFGNIENAPDEHDMALAEWWAPLFEIPGALFDPANNPASINIQNIEFIGLGDNVWNAKEGAASALATVLKNAKPEQ